MNKTLKITTILLLALSLTACAGNKREIGTILGAAAGAYGGSFIGNGYGRTAAIAGGTLLGAYIGGEYGQYWDDVDAMRAQYVLERGRSGQQATWTNPDTGSQVAMTPQPVYRSASGQNCRSYQVDVVIAGVSQHAWGNACRQPDGSWRIEN